MEDFKPLTLKDKNTLDKYFTKRDSLSYEYSFNSLFMWRNICNIKYSIIDNALIILREENNYKYFMEPLGYDKNYIIPIIEKLKTLSFKDNKFNFLFGDIEENFKNNLQNIFKDELDIFEDINDFEYIYKTTDLIDLNGHKYHKKRNYYSNFKKFYNYTIKSISNDNIKYDCLNFLNIWNANKKSSFSNFEYEKKAILECLHNMDYLDLKSIAIYDNNSLIGFSIGEIFNNMGIIHIEKANTNYKGIYPFLNKQFLIKDFSHTAFINRQEDCGDLGLRKSKESYYPIQKLKKYWIRFKI